MSIYKSLLLTSMKNYEKKINQIPLLHKANINNYQNYPIKTGNLKRKNYFNFNQKHINTFNNLENNISNNEDNFDIDLEFKKLRKSVDKLNEKLKEKDELILTL